jgi:hypothetical protein
LSSCTGGNVTIPLGFTLPYQNSLYNTIMISVNGMVFLNGTVFIGVNPNTFCTNNSGMVYFRQVTNAPDLATIGSKVMTVYNNYTFNPSYAYVVTW